MGINSNISSARRKLRLTQEQLAEKCGVSRQAVTKWESGESEPTISKLEILSEVLQIDLTELITGRKSDCQRVDCNMPVIDYRNLSAVTGYLTMDYPLDESSKLLILEDLFEVIETRYVSAGGEVFEKYLLNNTTKEERLSYVKVLACERAFAKDILQEYIDGKCEIDVAFKKLIHKVDEQYSIVSKIRDKRDESKIADVYRKVNRILLTMQYYDEYSEKKQDEVGATLKSIIDELCEDVPIQRFIIMYLNDILKAWNNRDKELLKILQEALYKLQEYVWNKIEI